MRWGLWGLGWRLYRWIESVERRNEAAHSVVNVEVGSCSSDIILI